MLKYKNKNKIRERLLLKENGGWETYLICAEDFPWNTNFNYFHSEFFVSNDMKAHI